MIGVQGNDAAQARVFAHDATTVVTDARVLWLELDTMRAGTGYTAGAGAVATTGTGVPAAFDVTITSVDADGAITGIVIRLLQLELHFPVRKIEGVVYMLAVLVMLMLH